MKKTALGVAFLSTFISGSALAGSIFLMPEIGYSQLVIDQPPEYAGDGDRTEASSSINVITGYKFDSNFLVGANVGFTESNGVFGFGFADHYSVDEYGVMLGYSINVAPHFRIVPAVGVARWELDSNSGWLTEVFHRGDEEEIALDGSDPYWRISLEFPLSRAVGLNLSHQQSNYAFGELQATRFGVKIEF